MSDQQYQVLQPVTVTGSDLKTYTGDSILKGCFPTAIITEKDADGVVLGFSSPNGPAAVQEFELGKVKCCTDK